MCKQSATKRRNCEIVSRYQYTENPIRLFHIQREEAQHYTVTPNGINIWRTTRNAKYREVTISLESAFGIECGCLMTKDLHVKCRHILAVEREYPQLVKSGPIGKMYSSALFVSAFSSYSIAMPSTEEIAAAGPGEFPAIVTAPHMKRTRGRPRVKRLRKWYEGLRRKMSQKAGIDPGEERRACSHCRMVGHDVRHCPIKQEFSSQQQQT
jgi:hypothetical protein